MYVLFTVTSPHAHSSPLRGSIHAPCGAKNAYDGAVTASQFCCITNRLCLHVNMTHRLLRYVCDGGVLLFTVTSPHAHSSPLRGSIHAPCGAKNAYDGAVTASQFCYITNRLCLHVNMMHRWFVM